MNWFKKIFTKKEEVAVQEIVQPAGDLIGQCALCGLAIGSEDRYMKLPTKDAQIAHKRCIRKSQKMMLNGVSQEKMLENLTKGGAA